MIEITSEFKTAFDILENTSDSLFITGKAGTGKSTFLDYFRKNTGRNVVVVAPTGVAALNVKGQTIHSFFRFKPRFITPDSIRTKKNRGLYKNIDVLVIDEISMVRADIFDAIEKFLRLNGPKRGEPFGGVQICIVGDLYQLPPIVSRDERDIFSQFYESPFFFSTDSFRNSSFKTIELTRVFRQTDDNFINFLNKLRIGDTSTEVMEFINERYLDPAILDQDTPIVLTTTNGIADNINNEHLCKINAPEYTYEGTVGGDFITQKTRLPVPQYLRLKVGSQVMFNKNDQGGRWVNGTIGTVSNVTEKEIEVAVKSNVIDKVYRYKVKKEKWETVAYEYNEATRNITEKITGKYEQYPLILAWAITIHKSQGKTLDSVIIELGRGTFAPGQLYVALSRCRAFNKIILKNRIKHSDIACDSRIVNFSENFLKKS